MANFRKAALSGRGGSVAAAHTMDNDFNDRLLQAESMMNKEMGHDVLFPRLMNVMSQDNLLDHQKL